MITDEINVLRVKLEQQIRDNEPYESIYKTSTEIDKLLTQYYKEQQLSKEV